MMPSSSLRAGPPFRLGSSKSSRTTSRTTGSTRSSTTRPLWLLCVLLFVWGPLRLVESATVYALYNVPPFAVTFETPRNTDDELENALSSAAGSEAAISNANQLLLLSETNGKDSGLSFPLRSITQSFLYNHLKPQISQLETQSNQFGNVDWFDMYSQFVGVDLKVQLYLVKTIQDGTEEGQRSLISKVALRAEMYGTLAFEEPPLLDGDGGGGGTKPSNQQVLLLFGKWMETLFASTNGRDAFLRELVQSDQAMLRELESLQVGTNLKDSGSNGGGTTGSNSNGNGNSSPQSSTYASGWSQRTEKALLAILILVGVLGLGWTTLSVRQRIRKRRTLQLVEDGLRLDSNDENDEDGYNFNATSMSKKPPSVTAQDRAESIDAVRHGSDVFYRSSVSGAMSVLKSTDRYLSKHRPDLYENNNEGSASAFNFRDYSIPSNPFEYIYSAFGGGGTAAAAAASNNKDGFSVSPQGAFTPSPSSAFGRRTSIEEQQQANIAAMRPFDEEMDHDDMQQRQQHPQQQHPQQQQQQHYHIENHNQAVGYRPISSIWRNVTHMWNYTYENTDDPMRARSTGDGIMLQTPQGSMLDGYAGHYHDHAPGDLELQTVQFYDDDQEDPSDYNFAFQDFPRHDGTPCLIFRENEEDAVDAGGLTPRQRQVFEIGSFEEQQQQQHISPPTATAAAPSSSSSYFNNTPVSNDAFARMLADQGRHSPDGTASFVDSESVFSDEPVVLPRTSSSASLLTEDADNGTNGTNSEFKDKLGRLVQQKHRQYEKKAIVEKHQERRAKERKTLREQEQREKHKAMERQIADMEAAFSSPAAPAAPVAPAAAVANGGSHSPKPSSSDGRWASSPNPYGAQQQQQQRYSPKPSGYQASSPYRQGYSPYRNTANNSRARPSPSRGNLARSHSYDRDDAAGSSNSMSFRPSGHSPYRHAVTKSSDAVPSPQPSFAPPGGMESMDENGTAPFRMRPRTTHATTVLHQTAVPPSDLFPETTSSVTQHSDSYRRVQHRSMDYSTLDKLSMPGMAAAGNASSNSLNSNGSGSSSKKYSPNSVMDDMFGGAPMSISRRKGSFGGSSTGSFSNTMAPQQQQQQQQQRAKQLMHRRVSSFDHKDSIGSIGGSGWERPVPQQRRGRGSKKQQVNAQHRALTPTRQDVRTTLNGGGSTPTRGGVRGMAGRPLTPMSHYNMHRGAESSTAAAAASRSGSTPRPSMQQQQHDYSHRPTSSSSSLSSSRGGRNGSGHSRSSSLDPLYTHGIIAQTRFV